MGRTLTAEQITQAIKVVGEWNVYSVAWTLGVSPYTLLLAMARLGVQHG